MKVLLTGANGYIGRRLKQKLLEQDISLRLLVRNPKSFEKHIHERTEVVKGDTFDRDALIKALDDVDVAYYLIHSLQQKNYKALDKESAQNFLDAAIQCGVKRIIYLGFSVAVTVGLLVFLIVFLSMNKKGKKKSEPEKDENYWRVIGGL